MALDKTPAEVSVCRLAPSLSVPLFPADQDRTSNKTDEIGFDLVVFANAKLV